MYQIDREAFKENFANKKTKGGKVAFKHQKNEVFKELPFTTGDSSSVVDFTGVLGAYIRLLAKKKLDTEISCEKILEEVDKKVDCSKNEQLAYQLQKIIKETYFDEDENLVYFSNRAMLYTNANKSDEKIARFLFDVLNNKQETQELSTYMECEADNVLDELMYHALPELKDKEYNEQEYMPLVSYVSRMYIEDFNYIASDPKLFNKYIGKLLDFYYFFYVSQLSLKLDQMFDADENKVEPLFFSVDWEKLSKSRQPYNYGWRKLEICIKKLFSHSKLLEMINYDGQEKHKPEENLTYTRIKNELEKIEETTYKEDIRYQIDLYTENVIDYDFDQIERINQYDHELLNDIRYWFMCIDAQFQATERKGAYDGYSNWFIKYCKKNCLKNRRSLGYTLNLTEDDIIFLTKICIKDKEKMRLQDLFMAFEQRGIMLDGKTRDEINEYYEKLNLIEKKSDSGDAQYVKGIL